MDYVAGVPDSGVPHAIGFANRSGKPFARPFVKYTPTWPRSFTPANQEVRNQVAKMKQIPVSELIQGKKLLFVDDSIVRGTQLRETVDFLYESGAEEVHMRSACPPIMYSCKYLNFSRGNSDMELLARRMVQELETLAGTDCDLPLPRDARTGAVITVDSFVGRGAHWSYSTLRKAPCLPVAAILYWLADSLAGAERRTLQSCPEAMQLAAAWQAALFAPLPQTAQRPQPVQSRPVRRAPAVENKRWQSILAVLATV